VTSPRLKGIEEGKQRDQQRRSKMTLKNAALLALIRTILITALLLWTFVFNVLNVLRGVVPAVMLFSSFIYAFACFTAAVFFYVFHRAQS